MCRWRGPRQATLPPTASGPKLCRLVTAHLLILGNREGFRWVLQEQRMAFATCRPDVNRLASGDVLLIYATRGCFGNPTRDRGRVIGTGKATSDVSRLRRPIRVGNREYRLACDLVIERLAPFGEGAELSALVDHLERFPNKDAWSAVMRRSVLTLPNGDARLLAEAVRPMLKNPREVAADYVDRATAGRRSGG
jgi:hypothetical protein